MAHMIEQMAYRGAVPWHGLGNTIGDDDTIEDIQRKAGLDWSVSKRPVMYREEAGGEYNFKDKFVLARDTDHTPFSVVSGRYKPVQPKEVLEFFRALLSRHNMKIETAGSLKGGQRIWALATTGDAHKVLGADEVRGYLNIATSYDLTFSTQAYFTSVRVVCNNTLQQSFGDQHGRIVIPHFREFKIDAVHEQLGLGQAQWEAFTKALDSIAKIVVDVKKAQEIVNDAFKVPQDELEAQRFSDHIHANNVVDMFRYRKYIGADLAANTGWGLVNATTEYVDHVKRARNQGNRLDSAWFGEGFNVKQRVFDGVLKLAA